MKTDKRAFFLEFIEKFEENWQLLVQVHGFTPLMQPHSQDSVVSPPSISNQHKDLFYPLPPYTHVFIDIAGISQYLQHPSTSQKWWW